MVYKFGPFCLDTSDRALLRDGTPVPLKPKAMELLQVLLEKRGQVTKDELRERLWQGTHVVDTALAFHMSAVRKALGDLPRGGQYIETVQKHGYRFIGDVIELKRQREAQVVSHLDALPASLDTPSSQAELKAPSVSPEAVAAEPLEARAAEPFPTRAAEPLQIPVVEQRRTRAAIPLRLAYAGLLVTVVSVLVGDLAVRRLLAPPRVPRVVRYRQLTNDGGDKGGAVLQVDADHVYFHHRGAEGLSVVAVAAQGGVTPPNATLEYGVSDISRERSEALVERAPCVHYYGCEMWVVPLSGRGPARRLGALTGYDATWSPDGQRIAFGQGRDLYVAQSDGSGVRRVATTPLGASNLSWSPDGAILRFSARGDVLGEVTSALWEVNADGTNSHQLLPGWSAQPFERAGNWTPDGRFFIFSASLNGRSDLWLLRAERHGSPAHAELLQLTAGPLSFQEPRASRDGKSLFAWGEDRRGELVRYDMALRAFVPYLGGLSAWQVRYSVDGQWMSFIGYPERTLMIRPGRVTANMSTSIRREPTTRWAASASSTARSSGSRT